MKSEYYAKLLDGTCSVEISMKDVKNLNTLLAMSNRSITVSSMNKKYRA
jgi:hypothetical protein